MRNLTDVEKRFVAEAEAGHFDVGYDDDGSPFALGAEKTGNLFKTVQVDEAPDTHSGGSCYTLSEEQ